jgi:hypothetical protein
MVRDVRKGGEKEETRGRRESRRRERRRGDISVDELVGSFWKRITSNVLRNGDIVCEILKALGKNENRWRKVRER